MVIVGQPCVDVNFTMDSTTGNLVDLCGRVLVGNYSDLVYPTSQPTRYLGMGFFPLLLVLSVAGNLFCIRMFMGEKRKRSPVVYLVTLCGVNIFVMLLDIPTYIGTYFESVREDAGYMDFMETSLGCLVWVQQTFILIASWILIISSIQRILLKIQAPFFPLRVRVRQAITACSILLIVAALTAVPDFVFYHQWWHTTQSTGLCDVTAPMLADWLDKWSRIRRSLRAFSFDLALPLMNFVILLVCAGVLLRLSKRRKRTRDSRDQSVARREAQDRLTRRLISEGKSPASESDGPDVAFALGDMPLREMKYASMLNRSILLYLITHSIDIIFSFLVLSSSPPSCSSNLPPDTVVAWQPIIHFLLQLNYSMNLFLYFSLFGSWKRLWRKDLTSGGRGPADYEMVPQDGTPRKTVRFTTRLSGQGGGLLDVKLPAMRREKSSVLLPEPVGTLLTGEMFRELWMFLPFRTRIYQPQLIFTTSEDGTSITNFLNTVRGYGATILVIKTMKEELLGAYCGSSWDERVTGKREYLFFGTGETFLFAFNPQLTLYPWIGLSGRKTSPDSCLFMAADAQHLAIGGGGDEAINFESSLARGFSGTSLTFNNPPLCENNEFESMVVEVYAFTDKMI